ncbi:MAG: cob(I)yrinic acid a,c-diamide adenosyltransferase [Gammaproteobacteria bacterium]
MGNRLSKIYTRTGDDGTTGLGNGERIRKDELRVEAYGTVDELSSLLGLLASDAAAQNYRGILMDIQHKLFDLGGELCIPDSVAIAATDVSKLETQLDALNADLEPLKDFVLPGGTPAAAACHVARTVCRRCERRLVSLAANEAVNPQSIKYLNRLSDLLFVVARKLNHETGHDEILWDSGRGK